VGVGLEAGLITRVPPARLVQIPRLSLALKVIGYEPTGRGTVALVVVRRTPAAHWPEAGIVNGRYFVRAAS
jgi:hypothetical protein